MSHEFVDDDIYDIKSCKKSEEVVIEMHEFVDRLLLSKEDVAHLARSLGFKLAPDLGQMS